MSLWTLAWRGFAHHWRTNLGVLVGCMVGAAVLVGALLVGDSLRFTLKTRAEQRIGAVDSLLIGGERLFRPELAAELADELGGAATTAAVLRLPASASADGERRVGDVALFGVDQDFRELAGFEGFLPPPETVDVSPTLAARLGVVAGDEVVLRVEKPSALPRDMILASTEDASIGLRVRVGAIVRDGAARFGFTASALPPANAFVDRAWLAEQVGRPGRANVILVGAGGDGAATAARANAALRERWSLADAELELDELEGTDLVELTSPRVFLDDPVGRALESDAVPAVGVLTYFVNALEHDGRSTPYSVVSALGALGDAPLPPALAALVDDGGVVVNDWLARDLGLAVGDALDLRYWVPGPDRRLSEETVSFPVARVVPLAGAADDPTLMPAFPGISDSESCRDWEPGTPVDLDAIDDEDEAYWKAHKGAPKAFLSLADGQRLWAGRFGDLTAVRAPKAERQALEDALTRVLTPDAVGLSFEDFRGPALAGATAATDFGGLFLGLSFFLIAAALLLTTLLFVFGVEQRGAEQGLLLALGYQPRQVRRLVLAEAALLALVGATLGAALGALYTREVLAALGGVWRDAVAGTTLFFHATPASLVGGALATVLLAVLAGAFALRGQLARSAVSLLATSEGVAPEAAAAAPRRARTSLVLAAVLAAGALVLFAITDPESGGAAAGGFFGAGAALLLAGLFAARWLFVRLRRETRPHPVSVADLGRRNAARRPGRSLAVVALVAGGTFLVVSIGVHEKRADASSAGTGDFTYIGELSLPLYEDLNDAHGRATLGLGALDGVTITPLRQREGDDASCLNLGTPQEPRLVGVRAEELAGRFAFTGDGGWELLDQPLADGAVPAIADKASAQWSMKKALGEDFTYVDERGRAFPVRLVATLSDSILQGDLLIAEAAFQERYPSAGGYRRLLIDVPEERREDVARELRFALAPQGLELVSTSERLAAFLGVQNTYLAIFQLLGGLGVLLGSIGLGVVLLRNALERRRELAMLSALGYRRRDVRAMLFHEHALLLALGFGVGAAAALLALLPVGGVPVGGALRLLAAIGVNGVVWVLLASLVAARGDALSGLRAE